MVKTKGPIKKIVLRRYHGRALVHGKIPRWFADAELYDSNARWGNKKSVLIYAKDLAAQCSVPVEIDDGKNST